MKRVPFHHRSMALPTKVILVTLLIYSNMNIQYCSIVVTVLIYSNMTVQYCSIVVTVLIYII